MRPSWTQLSASPRIVLFRWKSVVDHVAHAAPRAPGRWSGRRRGLGRRSSGSPRGEEYEVHWFGCGVRLPSLQGLASGGNSRGDEASAAAQPATGGRSMRHDRRCFGRLEQEDQRLKKHYGRWMDIVRSLQLESFILTKLPKPLVRQLSRPTGQLSKWCAPDVRGRNHFLGG